MNPASQHLEGKLLDYAYGELSEGEAKTVEAHLRACPQCADSLTAMKQVRRTMSQLPIAAAPQAGLESLLAYAQKAAETARARPARRPWLRWIAPIASVAALSVVLVISSKVMRRPEALVTLRQSDTRGDWENPPQLSAKKEAEAPAKEAAARAKEAEGLSQLATPPKDWKGAGATAAPEPAARQPVERIAQQTDQTPAAGDAEGARMAKVAAAPKPEHARRAAAPADDDAARGSARDEGLRRLASGSGPASDAIAGGVVGGTLASHPDAEMTAEKQLSAEVASQHAGAGVEAKQTPSALRARSSTPSSPAERPIDREREVAQLRQALASGAQGQERARLLRRLCDALDALGRTREADSACDTVAREFPASEEARSALERLKVRAAEPRR